MKFFGVDTEARRRPPPQVVRVGSNPTLSLIEDNALATHYIGFGYKYTSVTGDVQRYIHEYLVPSSLIANENVNHLIRLNK